MGARTFCILLCFTLLAVGVEPRAENLSSPEVEIFRKGLCFSSSPKAGSGFEAQTLSQLVSKSLKSETPQEEWNQGLKQYLEVTRKELEVSKDGLKKTQERIQKVNAIYDEYKTQYTTTRRGAFAKETSERRKQLLKWWQEKTLQNPEIAKVASCQSVQEKLQDETAQASLIMSNCLNGAILSGEAEKARLSNHSVKAEDDLYWVSEMQRISASVNKKDEMTLEVPSAKMRLKLDSERKLLRYESLANENASSGPLCEVKAAPVESDLGANFTKVLGLAECLELKRALSRAGVGSGGNQRVNFYGLLQNSPIMCQKPDLNDPLIANLIELNKPFVEFARAWDAESKKPGQKDILKQYSMVNPNMSPDEIRSLAQEERLQEKLNGTEATNSLGALLFQGMASFVGEPHSRLILSETPSGDLELHFAVTLTQENSEAPGPSPVQLLNLPPILRIPRNLVRADKVFRDKSQGQNLPTSSGLKKQDQRVRGAQVQGRYTREIESFGFFEEFLNCP